MAVRVSGYPRTRCVKEKKYPFGIHVNVFGYSILPCKASLWTQPSVLVGRVERVATMSETMAEIEAHE